MDNSTAMHMQAFSFGDSAHQQGFSLLHAPLPSLHSSVFRVPYHNANKALVYAPNYRSYALLDLELFQLLAKFSGQESFEELLRGAEDRPELEECFRSLYRLGLIETESGNQSRRRAQRENATPPVPSLILALTSDCNLGCVYCYASAHDNPENMVQGDYVEAIDYFVMESFGKCTQVELVLHGGGEPTLNPRRFREVVSLFYNKCKSFHLEPIIGMETNGCFAPSVLETIVEFDVKVGVSIDGLAEIHDKQRPFLNGKGSFSRIEQNLNALSERGVDVGVVSVVTEESLPMMLDFVRWCARAGVETINFEPVEGVGRADKNGICSPYMPDYSKMFTDSFLLGIELGVSIRTGVDIFGPAKNKYCGAAGNNIMFTPSGSISTCVEVLDLKNEASDEFVIGHFDSEEKKVEIWDESLQALKSRYVDSIPQCHSCFIRYSCGGGCPVHNKTETGNINSQKIDWCESMRSLSSTCLSGVFDRKIYKDYPAVSYTEIEAVVPSKSNLIFSTAQAI